MGSSSARLSTLSREPAAALVIQRSWRGHALRRSLDTKTRHDLYPGRYEHDDLGLLAEKIPVRHLLRTDCCGQVVSKKSDWPRRNFVDSRSRNKVTRFPLAQPAICPWCKDESGVFSHQLNHKGLLVGLWDHDPLFVASKLPDHHLRLEEMERILRGRVYALPLSEFTHERLAPYKSALPAYYLPAQKRRVEDRHFQDFKDVFPTARLIDPPRPKLYNLNKRDEVRGFTPLLWSIISHNRPAFDAILRHISDVKTLEIVDHENLGVIDWILQAEDYSSTERLAMFQTVIRRVRTLSGGEAVIKTFVRATHKGDATALHQAVGTYYCPDIARELIRLGANILAKNCLNETPIMSARANGHDDMVTLLHSFGAKG